MGNSLMSSYHQERGPYPPEQEVSLLDLPLLVMEKISEYLTAEDVWQLGATCRQLRELCTDEKLWRERVLRETRTLLLDGLENDQAAFLLSKHSVAMTIRNPLFTESRLHWCTVRPRKRPEAPSRSALMDSWALITDLVIGRSSTPAASGFTPRLLMYGSGLENKSVLRRMMMEKVEGLHVHSLVPSVHRGVGAGVRFRFTDGATFDLITLYSNTSEVRRRRTLGGAAGQTPLYANIEDGGRLKMEGFVLDLVTQADGVVHVVEVKEDKTDYGFEVAELEAMQEVVTESGRLLPLLTLQLVIPPETPSSARPQPPLGWRVQQGMACPGSGPRAVLTTPCSTLADLAHGFSWITFVSRSQRCSAGGAEGRRQDLVTFPFGAQTASAP